MLAHENDGRREEGLLDLGRERIVVLLQELAREIDDVSRKVLDDEVVILGAHLLAAHLYATHRAALVPEHENALGRGRCVCGSTADLGRAEASRLDVCLVQHRAECLAAR